MDRLGSNYGHGLLASPDDELVGGEGTTLEVSIADSDDPVLSATEFDLVCDVQNTGDATAENVEATLTLPANYSYVSGSGTGWSVEETDGVVTATRATLLASTTAQFTVTVTADDSALSGSATLDAVADNAAPASQDAESTNVLIEDGVPGMLLPRNPAEWALLSGSPPEPDFIYDGNTASGNLVNQGGGGTADLVPNYTTTPPTYGQSITGFVNQAVGLIDNDVGNGFRAASGVGWDPTADIGGLWIGEITGVAATNRNVFAFTQGIGGDDNGFFVYITSATGVLKVFVDSGLGVDIRTSIGQKVAIFAFRSVTDSRVRMYISQLTQTGGKYLGKAIHGQFTGTVSDGSKGLGAANEASTYAANAKCLRLYVWQRNWTKLEVEALYDSMQLPRPWSVPQDGPSQLYMPGDGDTTVAHDYAFLAAQSGVSALTTPTELHSMQDASGNATGKIGAFDLTKGTTASANTNMNVAAWVGPTGGGNRKCYDLAHNNGNSTLSTSHGDISTTSISLITLTDIYQATSSVQRVIHNLGGAAAASEFSVQVNVSAGGVGRLRVKSAGTTVDGTQMDMLAIGDQYVGSNVNVTTGKGYAFVVDPDTGNGEMVEVTLGTMTDGTAGHGVNASKSPAGQRVAWDEWRDGWEWGASLAAAKATIKAYLEALGCATITWL